MEGQSTFFTCEASGNPTPTVTWLRGDDVLPSNDRMTISVGGHTLWLARVQLSDMGVYECRVENEAHTISSFAQLVITQTGTLPLFPPLLFISCMYIKNYMFFRGF